MKASCDNAPITAPNNRDLDQIFHWLLQQTLQRLSSGLGRITIRILRLPHQATAVGTFWGRSLVLVKYGSEMLCNHFQPYNIRRRHSFILYNVQK